MVRFLICLRSVHFMTLAFPKSVIYFALFLQINRRQLLQSKCVFSGPASAAAAAAIMWCSTTWLPSPQILLSCVSNTAVRSGINSERSVKSHTECLGPKKPFFFFFYMRVSCFPSVKSEAMSQIQVFRVSRHNSPILRVKIGLWAHKILHFMYIWLLTCCIMAF